MGNIHGCLDEGCSAAFERRRVKMIRPEKRTKSGGGKRHHGRTAPVIRQDNWGGWSISRQGPSPHVSSRTVNDPEIPAAKKMSVPAGMMELMHEKA